jgi:hypothetical protein
MGIVRTAAEILAEIGDDEEIHGPAPREIPPADVGMPFYRPQLNPTQWKALDAIAAWTVEHGKPPTTRDIEAVLQVDYSTLRKRIRGLAAKRMVRVVGAKGGRLVLGEGLVCGYRYVPAAPHGLIGYRVFGCRCLTCRRANTGEPQDRAERVA